MLLTIVTLAGFSQVPAGGKMPQIPAIGVAFGKITDSAGKPLNGASVMLMYNKFDTVTKKFKQVLIGAKTTQANGDFRFETLPLVGQFTLNVSNTGFASIEKKFTIMDMSKGPGANKPAGAQGNGFAMPDVEKDLGLIKMAISRAELQAVTVVGTKPGVTMDIDKKVFNVDKNLVSAGGTAVDVMKNVPSVNVDIDGNVTLRNAAPQIYIDGRPTTLTLDQIPADAIESVEVITNPSARYDASGGNAGILNIVLKKNKKKGYNGSLQAGVDKRGGLNGGGSFSFREEKVNVTLSAFGNQMKNRSTGNTDIRNMLSSPNLLVDQNSNTRMNGGFIFGRAGVDYFATNRLTLSLAGVKVHGEFNPKDMLTSDSSLANGSYLSYAERSTSNKREFNAYGAQGGFKYLFPRKGEEWTGDFNIFSGKNNGNALYNTNIYSSKGGSQTGNIQQQIIGNGTNQFMTFQSDYVRPFKDNGKIETGVRAQLRKLSNGQSNFFFNSSTGKFEQVTSSSTNYKNNDRVYAAYVSVTRSIKNFGYQLGLRAESSNYKGELTDTKQEFSNSYPLSLFPSVFLSQKLKQDQELQLNYSRRVNRPFFMQTIPFIDSTDQLNWSRGNAGLKPEFTNSLEMSYSKKFRGSNTLLASVYFKHSTDLITRYLDTITISGGTKRPISTYINANSSRSVGFELTSQNKIAKWWDMNSNFNLYNSKINTDNINGTSQKALWSWFAKMNNNFTLPKNFKIQLSGTYQSKTNLPVNQGGGGMGGPMMGVAQSAAQGYIKSNWGIDAAVSKSFLKNNTATVTLSVSDIFRTRRMEQYSASDYFILNSYRMMDSPMFRLNFSWRFGQMDMSLFKRKNMKGEMEGSQGAMQGMQQ